MRRDTLLKWMIVTLCLLMSARSGYAARVPPPPLIVCFEKGYGVVAVSVIDAVPGELKSTFDVRCRVELLVAQVVAGEPLPVAIGDAITVTLSVGYSCQIENFENEPVPTPGAQYFLTLQYDAARNLYAQVNGASSVRLAKAIDADSIHRIRLMRAIAASTGLDRIRKAREALLDSVADLEVRVAARGVLRTVRDAQILPEERDETIMLLRRQWLDASMTQGLGSVRLGFEDLRDLDATLQMVDPAFLPASDMRIDRWLQVIFSPFDGNETDPVAVSQNMADRWNAHMYQLTVLGLAAPEKVSLRISTEMRDPNWPLQFRVGLARSLQGMFQRSDVFNDGWNTMLQSFYPQAFAEADPWVLRLLPSSIVSGMDEPKYDVKRSFIASEATWEAMTQALGRMHADANGHPRVPEAYSAEIALREALERRSR